MKINIKKLSELSGFSAATVSNALNGKRGVNHETAQQILALAREYGYVSGSRIQSIRLVTYRDSGEVRAVLRGPHREHREREPPQRL